MSAAKTSHVRLHSPLADETSQKIGDSTPVALATEGDDSVVIGVGDANERLTLRCSMLVILLCMRKRNKPI